MGPTRLEDIGWGRRIITSTPPTPSPSSMTSIMNSIPPQPESIQPNNCENKTNPYVVKLTITDCLVVLLLLLVLLLVVIQSNTSSRLSKMEMMLMQLALAKYTPRTV